MLAFFDMCTALHCILCLCVYVYTWFTHDMEARKGTLWDLLIAPPL